jgi:hypothetical protein
MDGRAQKVQLDSMQRGRINMDTYFNAPQGTETGLGAAKETERDTSSSNWRAICARCGPGSTGGWKISSLLTSSWRGGFPVHGGRPTT